MFLVLTARGQGLGPDAARTLCEAPPGRGRPASPLIRTVPMPPAVRAWTRAGFRPVTEHESDSEHREPWLLMDFDFSEPAV